METPSVSHISAESYEHIYEPAEDSFLLIDALEKDISYIKTLNPIVCLEVGSGSGIVLTALGITLGHSAFYIATDINPRACCITRETGANNGVRIETVRTDLVQNMDQLKGKVDLMVFNPPYVVTPPEEVGACDLASTWAGGMKGRQVMDRLFPEVHHLLSPQGVFYLLIIKENVAEEIDDIMCCLGFEMRKVLARQAGREFLSVLQFKRKV